MLSNFEPITDPTDWEVGKHGIEIEFKDSDGRPYRGTFLPNVAPEQGWDVKETMEALCRKAGYQGGFDSVRNNFYNTRRYQSIKFGVDYETWQASKKQ